jgi:acetyl esterase/lipase
MRRSRRERGQPVVIVIATAFVVVPALGVLGTYLYGVPYVGLTTAYVPQFVVWLLLASLAGGGLALYRWWHRRDLYSMAVVMLAVVTVVGAGVITGRMTAAVDRAGADISLFDAFGVGVAKSAVPDADVVYSAFDGGPLSLSIFRPPGVTAASTAPVLVYIHGGGWVSGDRNAHSADLRWFADQGWLTITVDYPLSDGQRHLWNLTQNHIGCALAWVAVNAGKYGGDPNRLALSGDSAGGNLAINAAYLAAGGALPSTCGGRVPVVRAVSVLYPVVDPAGFYANPDPALGGASRDMAGAYTGGSPQQFPDRYTAITSGSYLSRLSPPTLMIVGAADHLVPVAGAYRFAEVARAAGVDVKLVAVPYADHVFDGRPGSIGQQAYRQLTAQWLRAHGLAP